MMYSSKENVNILTALLQQWGVVHAVVCPGSRNAPIVHNLKACGSITCYPVTDERSAGFFALGLSQVADEPVVVCVTSGSALLNVAPAAAEALYQRRKLIIVSADRPASMIGQLQGQTMHQPTALTHFVRKAVNLPEPHDDTERWYCNRLVNEALIELERGDGGPVHINVPISEPLFDFSARQLPTERVMHLREPQCDIGALAEVVSCFAKAKRPMIVIGQSKYEDFIGADDSFRTLGDYCALIVEQLGNAIDPEPCFIDETLIKAECDEEKFLPDVIVFMGGNIVSKRLRLFLRKAKDARTFIVNKDGAARDIFMHATDIVQASVADMLEALATTIKGASTTPYNNLWMTYMQRCCDRLDSFDPCFSQMSAVRDFCAITNSLECECHFANSTSVRLGMAYLFRYMFVNRGMNGIEGSLSTAVGYARGIDCLVFCVIGDLSFFYDQNALWNNNLTSNLRILLLNNGEGAIFRGLPGLADSPASEQEICGAHVTSAEGICEQNNVRYFSARNTRELRDGLEELIDEDCPLPVLLEVFTNAETDAKVLYDYLYAEKKQAN